MEILLLLSLMLGLVEDGPRMKEPNPILRIGVEASYAVSPLL